MVGVGVGGPHRCGLRGRVSRVVALATIAGNDVAMAKNTASDPHQPEPTPEPKPQPMPEPERPAEDMNDAARQALAEQDRTKGNR